MTNHAMNRSIPLPYHQQFTANRPTSVRTSTSDPRRLARTVRPSRLARPRHQHLLASRLTIAQQLFAVRLKHREPCGHAASTLANRCGTPSLSQVPRAHVGWAPSLPYPQASSVKIGLKFFNYWSSLLNSNKGIYCVIRFFSSVDFFSQILISHQLRYLCHEMRRLIKIKVFTT